MAFSHGNVDDSRKWAEEAIRLDRNQLLARWIVAELDRTAGRLDEAQRSYHWLVNYYNDHDEMSAEQLRWIGLAPRNGRGGRGRPTNSSSLSTICIPTL